LTNQKKTQQQEHFKTRKTKAGKYGTWDNRPKKWDKDSEGGTTTGRELLRNLLIGG